MARRRRLGLRARVTFIYALGALLLSSMVAIGTFTLAQARLVSEAEEAARDQVFSNAIDLRRRLQSIPDELLDPDRSIGNLDASASNSVESIPPASDNPEGPLSELPTEEPEETTPTDLVVDIDDVLDQLDPDADRPTPTSTPPASDAALDDLEPGLTVLPEPDPTDAVASVLEQLLRPNRSDSLLIVDDLDRSLTGLRRTDVPADLLDLVMSGGVGERRYAQGGETKFAVGVPISTSGDQYFEVVSLADLQATLNSLQAILAGTALAASLAGAALGSYSARKALQPLAEVSFAAASIAEGQFDTRLDDDIDPDLAGLTSSFNDMVDALQARIDRDGRFASDVSHELRSPLMTLAASVGILEGRRDDLPIPAQQAVGLLSQDLRRFERLVEDLLEISRMDAGAIELEADPVFLAEFLEFVVAQSRSPEVPVEYVPENAGLVVMADKRRLAQAINNLLDNAVKYADERTTLSFEQDNEVVRIHVDDRGPGVRPVDRERIFDRFSRAGADAGRRGTATGVGLGLSLVSEHVRLHGGSVWVTDRPDGLSGARFVVELPVRESVEVDEEMAT